METLLATSDGFVAGAVFSGDGVLAVETLGTWLEGASAFGSWAGLACPLPLVASTGFLVATVGFSSGTVVVETLTAWLAGVPVFDG